MTAEVAGAAKARTFRVLALISVAVVHRGRVTPSNAGDGAEVLAPGVMVDEGDSTDSRDEDDAEDVVPVAGARHSVAVCPLYRHLPQRYVNLGYWPMSSIL